MGYNTVTSTPSPSTPSPRNSSQKSLLKHVLIVMLILFFCLLINKLVSLNNENNNLIQKNTELHQKINILTEKNSALQINLKELNSFYELSLLNLRKIERKYKKISYFHQMLKKNSKALLEKLKKRINDFQIKGGDCTIYNIIKNSYEQFQKFYSDYYGKP